jgi:PadR family transcriptional regulator, regulatory protein PadR
MARISHRSKQTMQVLQMFVLQDEALYGSEIVKALGLKEGTVYPLLHRLEKGGYLHKAWANPELGRPPRCYYTIGAAGISLLRELRQRFI